MVDGHAQANAVSGSNEVNVAPSALGQIKSSSYQMNQPPFYGTVEIYEIISGDGQESYEVVRPRHSFRGFIAVAGAAILSFVAANLVFWVTFAPLLKTIDQSKPELVAQKIESSVLPSDRGLNRESDNLSTLTRTEILALLLYAVLLLTVLPTSYIFLLRRFSPIRRIQLFIKGERQIPVLSLEPATSVFTFNHEYIVRDQKGLALASFRKNVFKSFVLRRWHCYDGQGAYQFSASENSLLRAVLRRLLLIGEWTPIHFNFSKNGDKSFGSFTRAFKPRDQFRIDFEGAEVAPWQMVVSAILLVTGERR